MCVPIWNDPGKISAPLVKFKVWLTTYFLLLLLFLSYFFSREFKVHTRVFVREILYIITWIFKVLKQNKDPGIVPIIVTRFWWSTSNTLHTRDSSHYFFQFLMCCVLEWLGFWEFLNLVIYTLNERWADVAWLHFWRKIKNWLKNERSTN